MEKIVLNNEKNQLNILFYNENIVRFVYGDYIPTKNITDAIILEPTKIDFTKENNKIISKNFDIIINNDLTIKIFNKQGEILLEDAKIEFESHETVKNKLENPESLDSVLSERDLEIINPIRVERKVTFEKGFYGLGEKYGFINLIDRDTYNWNTDVLGVTTIHNPAQRAYHTSIPFYIATDEKKSYGLFYDTSYKTYFDFKKLSENVVYKADGGILDYYFIYGENVKEIVQNYAKLTGTVKLPRKDFIGFQQCRWSYMSTEETLEIAKKFRENNIPADVIYLDIDYMENYKVFTIDSEKFKDFKNMTNELHKMGFKLVVIIDPGVKVENGYKVYEEGIENDYFIKDKNGEVYIGKVWPGDSSFPDFLRDKVRKWWGELHKDLIDLGVDGIWNDMNEIADMSRDSKTVPEDSYHIDGNGNKRYQKEIHNLYGHYEAIATYEGLKNIQNTRPFVLTRSASAGTQRYSALWTGDNSSVWEHLEGSIPMLLNLGLSGYSYVGSDIGGFIDDTNKELLIRWTQLGIFYPLSRNHSVINSRYQEPFAFDNETTEITKKYIKLRYKFIDYLYNLFRESSLTGNPILRPLFYHYQDDIETHNINDEFLFGEDILVAPIVRPKQNKRLVYLPKGKWINYFTKEEFEGNNHYIMKADLSELLLFVKKGAILIENSDMNYIFENNDKITIHIYSDENSSSKEFYFDDGLSFEYENEKYSIIKIEKENNFVKINKVIDNYTLPKFDLVIHKENDIIKYENIEFEKEYSLNE
ncbi:MAG: alpha-glucosidase [Fusobacteriaceae bacterium]|jgi:alpha-glucosidase|nr:alpha-glucosidase [Fusobacteriaceae bacterium]